MGTQEVVSERSQLLLRQPVRDRPALRAKLIGRVRLPLAGPYRPWVRVYIASDGRVYSTVRLWEIDRANLRRVEVDTLRQYARTNRLHSFAEEFDRLVERARAARQT